MSQTCLRCTAENDDGSAFCKECGNGLQATKYDPLKENPGFIEESQEDTLPNEYAEVISLRIAAAIMNIGIQFLTRIPILGWILGIAWYIWTLILNRRGQDPAARILKIRIVRKNGDLSGFYHTYTRGILAIIIFICIPVIGWIGTGWWTAFFHPKRQTWHDRLMSTYVIKDSPELANIQGTSARGAKIFFWITIILISFGLLIPLFIIMGFLFS